MPKTRGRTSHTMAYDNDNIFAKILRGEIPCHKVFEDDDVIVFMDAMPQAPGHTLVVPKAASRNLLDADPAILAKLLPVVQKVAHAVKNAFAADGVSIFQYNETAGGQSVFHLHIHVVPRHDGVPLGRHSDTMEDQAVLAANAEKVRSALGS